MREETLQELAATPGIDLPYTVNHIPKRKGLLRAPNRSGRVRPGTIPTRSTQHGTGNFRRGANRRMHEAYVRAPNWGGPGQTSYHHVTDQTGTTELLPWEEEAYHGGTPDSNLYWLGHELCEAEDTYTGEALENAAKLEAVKAFKFGQSVFWLLQHNAAYGKNCPQLLRRGYKGWDWKRFTDRVNHYISVLKAHYSPTPPPPPQPPPAVRRLYTETGKWVNEPFLSYYDKNGGFEVFGYPVLDAGVEMLGDGKPYLVQWFQRGMLHTGSDGKVYRGLAGEMYLKASGRL
jgi:hypothetical protein